MKQKSLYRLVIILFGICAIFSCKNSDPSQVKCKLYEIRDHCIEFNDRYSSISVIMNDAEFDELCDFAGWPHNELAALQMQVNSANNWGEIIKNMVNNAIQIAQEDEIETDDLYDIYNLVDDMVIIADESRNSSSIEYLNQNMSYYLQMNNKVINRVQDLIEKLH